MERKYLFGIEDDGKTAGMISYFFVLGWSLSFFGFHLNNRERLSAFHLRQTLFLFLSYLVIRLGLYVATGIFWHSPASLVITYLVWVLNIVFFIFWTIGLNGASKAEEKAMPLIGEFSQNVFSFIKE